MRLKKYVIALLMGVGIAIATVFSVLSASAQTCEYHAEAYDGLELTQLSQELTGTGLIGRIHGAAAPAKMVVLSVREANNFFNHREFSLLAGNDEVQASMDQLHRHDQICIQGDVITNPSPQSHVVVTSLEVMEPWTGLDEHPEYDYEAGIPEELMSQTEFVGKVHAIGEGGKVLVMEYKDRVLPIFVENPEITQTLYRGDIVRLAYQVQQWPQQPTHLLLNSDVEQPIEVVDAIASWHGQQKTLSGRLVQFPKSPQLRFDVYAIEVETDGINRTFTLLNFEDMAVFEGVRNKLATIWETHQSTVVRGRNFLMNPDVIVQASGMINVISPEQANPQVLLESVEDVGEQA